MARPTLSRRSHCGGCITSIAAGGTSVGSGWLAALAGRIFYDRAAAELRALIGSPRRMIEDLHMLLLMVGTVTAGLFAGAAIYISAVEHPARLSCGIELAVREFRPSYRRAADAV